MKSRISSQKVVRYSKPTGLSPAAAARKALLRRIQRQELRKLQALIPAMSGRSYQRQPDPCAVILNAVRYIDDLHATILARVRSGSLSPEVLDRLNLPEITEIQQVHTSRRHQVPTTMPTLPFSQQMVNRGHQERNSRSPLSQRQQPASKQSPSKQWNFSF